MFLVLRPVRRACTSNNCGILTRSFCNSALVPLQWSTGDPAAVKFVMYKSGAAHPIYGDETRELARTARMHEDVGCQPDRAVVALRHPRLSRASLGQMRLAYASKLRVGGLAVVVDDGGNGFDRVEVVDQPDATMRVMPTTAGEANGAGDRRSTISVPGANVFGGWPARSAELTYPVHMLAEDIEFMWPETVSQRVVVKRGGTPVDPNTGLGSLLRAPRNLYLSVNNIDYPLEIDAVGSEASRKESRRATRRHIRQVLLSEFNFLKKVWPLLLFWLYTEYKMYRIMRCNAGSKPSDESPRESHHQTCSRTDYDVRSSHPEDACTHMSWAWDELPWWQNRGVGSHSEVSANRAKTLDFNDDSEPRRAHGWGVIEW